MLDLAFDDRPISRRTWLRIGLAGAAIAPFASADETAASGKSAPGFGRAKSVILVYASGGQSHIDMWDPKPLAPAHVRGEFNSIPTAIPGTAFGEHLPRLAQLANLFTVVRSMSHEDLDHGSATYLSLTGRYHTRRSSNPDPQPSDFPVMGAALKRTHPRHRFLYEAVHVNGPNLIPKKISPGQNGGFLGREYDPLVIGDVTRATVAIEGLAPRRLLPAVRLQERLKLKEMIDSYAQDLATHPEAADFQGLYRQALEMLTTPRCREAFDLSAESETLRDDYGRHRSGQACLLARRLVEAGVPLITVFWNHNNRGQDDSPGVTDQYGWDTHNDIFSALKTHLLPRFDRSFAALLKDLRDRGLLDSTLVVCMGEFGRAPTVALEPNFAGSSPGRKHWAAAYSVLFAGAGVGQGAVLGATDRLGGSVTTRRYGPWDIAATIYNALGTDPHRHFADANDRPFALTLGRPISELYQS